MPQDRSLLADQLILASKQWRAIFDSIKEILLIVDTDLKIIRANKSAVKFFETDFQTLIGSELCQVLNSVGIYVYALQIPDFKKTLKIEDFDILIEQRQMWLTVSITPMHDECERLIGAVIILKDISELKKTEIEKTKMQMQLLQSHKMESIGRLAGGLAHDFNNILTVILGYAEMAKMELPEEYPVTEMITQIEEAAKTAVELNSQLLAFSRKQMLSFSVINLNTIITDMYKILSRLIGDDIAIVLNLSEGVKNTEADKNQIKQVLMNLVINAKDAMPHGGTITISTENAQVDESIRDDVNTALEYVLLSVKDTGVGIPQDIINDIFEPFFTTKETGKGTGLGLATVYGIVKQHSGFIKVFSTVNEGTEFKIYLPATNKPLIEDNEQDKEDIAGGEETLLIVDDNSAIAMFLYNIFGRLGYKVHLASSGATALEMITTKGLNPDALITDVKMPGLSGIELASKCRQILPNLKVLLMSGYITEFAELDRLNSQGFDFISKPFTAAQITKKLRLILDRQK